MKLPSNYTFLGFIGFLLIFLGIVIDSDANEIITNSKSDNSSFSHLENIYSFLADNIKGNDDKNTVEKSDKEEEESEIYTEKAVDLSFSLFSYKLFPEQIRIRIEFISFIRLIAEQFHPEFTPQPPKA